MLSKDRALLCAGYALEKKALNVRVLNVRGLSSLTDYLVIASGQSDRQVQAIAESVRVGLKLHHDLPPMAVEGVKEGRWVLLDYGDVMVHVFHEPVRDYYDLDGLWREAIEVPVPEDNPAVHKG
ncbi:MAG: ribosome silencing factor [Deltaproteobacteria bacterium HGW-Deltaproteobacteria-4]|nr:MAG: ribosome silencing factor [Deltaproteobacteria bacterium HGW-Deltaproteobacteria-4]